MFFQVHMHTPPNRLITPHRLRHQHVLIGLFAVHDWKRKYDKAASGLGRNT